MRYGREPESSLMSERLVHVPDWLAAEQSFFYGIRQRTGGFGSGHRIPRITYLFLVLPAVCRVSGTDVVAFPDRTLWVTRYMQLYIVCCQFGGTGVQGAQQNDLISQAALLPPTSLASYKMIPSDCLGTLASYKMIPSVRLPCRFS